MSDEPPPSPAPRRCGEYVLEKRLGEGGMGVVYEARHYLSRAPVALKLLKAEAPRDEEYLRFQTEWKALQAITASADELCRRHVVPWKHAGWHDDGGGRKAPYFTMELLTGAALGARLAALPADALVGHLAVVAETVHRVHALGYVHRDLKPGNIFLAREVVDGRPTEVPKVLDFGLAKATERGGDHSASTTAVGTPYYMAPEQARGNWGGRALDGRVDVYSLGAILYEYLTGRPPYHELGPERALVAAGADGCGPKRPTELKPAADPRLEAVCLKALAKYPEDRYVSAGELAADLRRYLNGEPVRAHSDGLVARLTGLFGSSPGMARFHGWRALLVASAVFGVVPNLVLFDMQERRVAPGWFAVHGACSASCALAVFWLGWRWLRSEDVPPAEAREMRGVYFMLLFTTLSHFVIALIVIGFLDERGPHGNLGFPFGCVCNAQTTLWLAYRYGGFFRVAPVIFVGMAVVIAADLRRAPLYFAAGWFFVLVFTALAVNSARRRAGR